MDGKFSICGHSLGASRTAILAGLCAAGNIPPAAIFMFEPARPGYAELGAQVRARVPTIVATRNARDFVPDLPPALPFPYEHIVELIDLNNPAKSADPVEDHMIDAVIAGVLERWPE